MCTRPYNPYTNVQRVYRNYSNKIDQPQRTAARWSPHNVVCSAVAPTSFCSTLILILPQLDHPFQAHLTLFLTIMNNNTFQYLYPTQWPTVFPISSRIPSSSWMHNHGNNPQTLHKQRTSLAGYAAASLAGPAMSSSIPNPRYRAFSCLPTPFGPRWSKKSWTI